MWEISKSFDFCFGHRVAVQQLDSKFSMDNKCACRHLHGHQGKVIVHFSGNDLNDQSMITDFKHANWLKVFLDKVMDHKFLVDMADPFLTTFMLERLEYTNEPLLVKSKCGSYRYVNPKAYKNKIPFEHEIYEGLIIVEFVPTAENFSKWLFEIVNEKMLEIGVNTSKVEFYETPKCKSVYIKE